MLQSFQNQIVLLILNPRIFGSPITQTNIIKLKLDCCRDVLRIWTCPLLRSGCRKVHGCPHVWSAHKQSSIQMLLDILDSMQVHGITLKVEYWNTSPCQHPIQSILFTHPLIALRFHNYPYMFFSVFCLISYMCFILPLNQSEFEFSPWYVCITFRAGSGA